MAHGKQHGVGGYVVVALILGVITFVEFAIVEWPPTFMSPGWVLFWLITLSIVKFWMVIWFFMHLKEDDRLYTGFFSSGMVIAMGTFVALVFMFLLPRAVAPVVAPAASAEHGDGHYAAALPAEVVANIATDGASRPLAERARAPRPADRSLVVTPPAAAVDGFEVRRDAMTAVVGTEAGDPISAEAASPAMEGPDPEFDRALGLQVYASCRGCHQPTGAGIPGVFPPLAGHAGELFELRGGIGGRTYLIDVILYGLQGPIAVDGVTYNGVMPAWPNLGDEQVAAVVNHIVAGFDGVAPPEGFDAVRPDEVAALRGRGLSGADVHALREGLAEAPAEAAPEPAAGPEPATAEPAAAPAAAEAAPPPAADPVAETVAADPAFDRDAAAQLYVANCAACHQPTGAGLPGVFPPLAGHAVDLYVLEGGRDYLIDVLLYGLQGPITANGVPYNSLMPAWAQLGDEQIALLINHTVAGFEGVDAPIGFDAIRAEEVEARRGQGLSGAQTLERRRALGLD